MVAVQATELKHLVVLAVYSTEEKSLWDDLNLFMVSQFLAVLVISMKTFSSLVYVSVTWHWLKLWLF